METGERRVTTNTTEQVRPLKEELRDISEVQGSHSRNKFNKLSLAADAETDKKSGNESCRLKKRNEQKLYHLLF